MQASGLCDDRGAGSDLLRISAAPMRTATVRRRPARTPTELLTIFSVGSTVGGTFSPKRVHRVLLRRLPFEHNPELFCLSWRSGRHLDSQNGHPLVVFGDAGRGSG